MYNRQPPTYQNFQLLQVLHSKNDCKFGKSESHGHFGVHTSLSCHVVEPLSQVDVSLHPKAELVHIAEVEHGLCIVLLLAGDSAKKMTSNLSFTERSITNL